MLLFELATTFALFALDSLAFLQRKHLLILDAQLAALQLKMVESIDNHSSFLGGGEIGESQAAENAIVEVVVESVWQRQSHLGHKLNKLFLLDGKWNVLDDDRSWDQLIFAVRVEVLGRHLGRLRSPRQLERS